MRTFTMNEPGQTLKRLASEADVASALSITPRHLRSLRARHLIPYVRLGRVVRLDPEEVSKAVARLTVAARE